MHPDARGLIGREPKPIIPDRPPPDSIVLQDLVEGIGNVSSEGAKLTVQYAGFDYATGQKFASSWDDGKPKAILVGRGELIEGLEEALQELETGDRREIIVPPDSARNGWPAEHIPRSATAVFVVDLLSVKTPR